MTAGIDAATAMTLARAQPPQAPASTANANAALSAAKQFESVFISEFLGSMFENIPTDGPTGGGPGEEMFRSLMTDQYAKQLEKQGGFGLAAPVARQLLKLQESHQ
jgi:Rod binding domain-containing protein